MITPSFFPVLGGTETYVAEASNALRKKGNIVDILTVNMDRRWDIKFNLEIKRYSDYFLYRWGGFNPLNLLKLFFNVEINRFFNNSIPIFLFNIHFIPLKLNYLKELVKTYEILIFVDVIDYSFPIFIKKTKNQKRFFVCHTVREFFRPRKPYKRLIEYVLKFLANKYIVDARSEIKLLEEIGISRYNIKNIPIGVDLTKFSPKKTKKIKNRMIFIGRCTEKRKGFHILLNAIKQINTKIELIIVDFKPQYLEKLSKINKNEIIFIGKVDQNKLIEEISKSEVLIFPSLAESFGIVCLESIACGTPVISSDLPCIHDFLNEDNSILFKPGDAKDLSKAIDRFFNLTNAQREKMANLGRQKIMKEFSWEIISEKLEDLFN